MTVKEMKEELGLKLLSGERGVCKKITGGYVSDLLSDVMGNADAGEVWITLQTHKNVMAIASLKDLAAIILVNGHKPEEDTIDQSNLESVPILSTELSAFEITGKIFNVLQ